MKRLVIYFFCILLTSSASSQDLAGDWKGYFTYDKEFPISLGETPIALRITLNSDSSYNILSYTKSQTKEGKDSIETCQVKYKKIGRKYFKFEEQNYLDKKINKLDFQKMYLYFHEKNDIKTLHGKWQSVSPRNSVKGEMFFTKVN